VDDGDVCVFVFVDVFELVYLVFEDDLVFVGFEWVDIG